jgi:sugar phosphate isomerase/epimerase
MELRLIRHLWGVEEDPVSQLDHWEKVGYRGLEIPIVMMNKAALEAAQARQWHIVTQIFSDGWNYSHDVATHVASFQQQLEESLALGADTINCHGGEDGFSDQQAQDFFGQCLEIINKHQANVVWETHRGRSMFNPWRTLMLTEALPDLQLCADFSHWTCTCERLLDSEAPTLEAMLPKIGHIHARIGYSQGPQVPDPRAHEYANEVAWFGQWWQRMWQAQAASGRQESIVCPEFGPIPYLHTLPYSNLPVARLADICDWTAGHLQELFAATSFEG